MFFNCKSNKRERERERVREGGRNYQKSKLSLKAKECIFDPVYVSISGAVMLEKLNSQIFLKIYEWMIVEDILSIIEKETRLDHYEKVNNKFLKFAKKLSPDEQKELLETKAVTNDLKLTRQAYQYMLPRLPYLYK